MINYLKGQGQVAALGKMYERAIFKNKDWNGGFLWNIKKIFVLVIHYSWQKPNIEKLLTRAQTYTHTHIHTGAITRGYVISRIFISP